MKNFISKRFIENIGLLPNISQADLGEVLEKIVLGRGGLNYFRMLYNDPELGIKIKEIKEAISTCKKFRIKGCKKDLQNREKEFGKLMKQRGLLYNDDIMDVFWEELSTIEEI